ncbi:hypothetical protein OMCYN_00616 [cyanobiont of Ornithocercus magnificus]|nr:hypothetical protein OMCYN_00616 [cyanobiont of Ornithocercus magnificus]
MIVARFREPLGVPPTRAAEITPSEPDSGHADAGK